MARRLVEAGVNLVQVNLGNNETWDTHGNAFPHLKDKLFPPTDQALSALLDDLHEQRPARLHADRDGRRVRPHAAGSRTLPQHYKLPGRDHWGAVQTVFFAGGGVRGGPVIGSSDKIGGFPAPTRRPREHGRHDLPLPRPAPHRRLARQPGSAAPRLPRRADRGAVVMDPQRSWGGPLVTSQVRMRNVGSG